MNRWRCLVIGKELELQPLVLPSFCINKGTSVKNLPQPPNFSSRKDHFRANEFTRFRRKIWYERKCSTYTKNADFSFIVAGSKYNFNNPSKEWGYVSLSLSHECFYFYFFVCELPRFSRLWISECDHWLIVPSVVGLAKFSRKCKKWRNFEGPGKFLKVFFAIRFWQNLEKVTSLCISMY